MHYFISIEFIIGVLLALRGINAIVQSIRINTWINKATELKELVRKHRESVTEFRDVVFDSEDKSRIYHPLFGGMFGEPYSKAELYTEYKLKEKSLPVGYSKLKPKKK